jgi:2-oxoglutarate dehydrogenase E2 component (dihydrolipoamide succinyltransferase)
VTIELKVPQAGESITEVVISQWLKSEGAIANQDEALALIETDKANVEVLAPARGRVARILRQAGETVRVGEVIGILEEEGASAPAGSPAAPRPAPVPAAAAPGAAPTAPAAPTASAPVPRAPLRGAAPESGRETSSAPGHDGDGHPEPGSRMTPARRRALREAQARSSTLRADESAAPPARPIPVGADDASGRAVARTNEPIGPASAPSSERHEEVVPMTPLRKRVAERLLEAQETAALLTTFNEIDMSAVIALRKQHQDAFVEKHGIKLGFMSLFVKAAIEALRAYPAVNAEIRGNDIVYHRYYDIGVAVGGGRGLVVPIIRNAERLGFAEIEKTIADFAARAKESRLKLEELRGGTFTISNGGIYGSLMSTPIVNPPQSGILGMHAIQERPIVKNGAIAIAPMMYVALTYDHRIIDGREAVSFLVRIKECVENPARILLEV